MDPYTKLFNNVDMDANGTIDLNEFISMLKVAHYDLREEDNESICAQNEAVLDTCIPPGDEITGGDGYDNIIDTDKKFVFVEDKRAAQTLSRLSSLEVATKPSPNAVKRSSQFKSPHRQYVEKNKQSVKIETNEVRELNSWGSTHTPFADDPCSTQTTPRRGHTIKQFYTYQCTDGCLIMHERRECQDSDSIKGELPQDKNLPTTAGDVLTTTNQQNHHLQPEDTQPQWQEISSVDLSDTKKRDPNNFTILSGDCSRRKKNLCWKQEDDSPVMTKISSPEYNNIER